MHGYLLCLVSDLQDPAVYLTSEEYDVKTGKAINIQKILEKPYLHFIALETRESIGGAGKLGREY